jgi:hypothetical protein
MPPESGDGFISSRSLAMMKERAAQSAPGTVYDRPGDFNFALGVAVLALLVHTFALVGELYRVAESRSLISSSISRLFVLIELCLLINVAGLWVRKTAGLLVSMAALVGVCVSYANWYAYSRHAQAIFSLQPFYQLHPEAIPPHPLGLLGATWVNLIVLVISSVLLVWEAKTLRSKLCD